MVDSNGRDTMEKDEPSFETVLERLGAFGKFQRTQLIFCFLTMFLTASTVLSFVFQGYEPHHLCNSVNETKFLSKYDLLNDSTSQIVYGSCEIKLLSNQSGKEKEVEVVECPNGRDFFDAKHTTFLSEWDLVCESRGVAEVSQTFLNIGQMIGAVVGPFLTDRFGRRPIFVGSSLLLTITEWCIVGAPTIFVVYGLKIMSGVFYQSLVCCFFVYAMEFVTPRHREAVGCVSTTLWVVATMTEGALGYIFRSHSWRYLQGATGVMGLISLVYPFVMYESPRWLAANGKIGEALCVLEKASKMNGKDYKEVKQAFLSHINHTFPSLNSHSQRMIEEDGVDITSDVVIRGGNVNHDKKVNILDLLRNKHLRKRVLITWYLFVTNVMTYYGLYMTSSTVAGNRFLNYTLLTIVEFPSLVCLYYMMKKWNRRLVLMIALGSTSVCLMTSTLLLTFGENLEGADTANTVLFILGKFSITAAFTVIYLLAPEIFPTNLRSTANGVCNGLSRVGAMVAPFMRPLYSVARWGPGLIFSLMCMVAIFLILMLPESKDVGLPNTIDDVEKKSKSDKLVK